jgi:APA family basic amino acid/polyamine antiporter
VAKLGSTFNLLVFGMLNLAVIVMRESRIDSYDPSFRVPLYPWLPVFGILLSAVLIVEMGWLAIVFSIGVVLLGLLWFVRYARRRVERSGASRFVFARWGRYRHPELRTEFWEIIKEKGLREHDPYDEIVHHAEVIEVQARDDLARVIDVAAQKLAVHLPLSTSELADCLAGVVRQSESFVEQGVVFVPLVLPNLEHAHLVLARATEGMRAEAGAEDLQITGDIYGAVFLISPQHEPGQHLRVLAELAERPRDEAFLHAWRRISDHSKLKEMLLRDARFLVLFVGDDEATRSLAGMQVAELDLPSGGFIAVIRRRGELMEPRGDTVVQFKDSLTFIGEVGGIERLYRRYIDPATT